MTKLNELSNKERLAWLDKLAGQELTSNLRGVRTWHSPVGECDVVGLEAWLHYGAQRFGNDGVGGTKDLSESDKAKAIDGAIDRLERAKRGDVGRVRSIDEFILKVVLAGLSEESAKAFAKIDKKDSDAQGDFLESLFKKASESDQAAIRAEAESWRTEHAAELAERKAKKAAIVERVKGKVSL